MRIAGQQAVGEAAAAALGDERRARRQREPLGDRPGEPAGMLGCVEVLGEPTVGIRTRELDLAVAVEQNDGGPRRRIGGERLDEAAAGLSGSQRALEHGASDVEHVAVALGELALGAPQAEDDRLAATGAHADRDLGVRTAAEAVARALDESS